MLQDLLLVPASAPSSRAQIYTAGGSSAAEEIDESEKRRRLSNQTSEVEFASSCSCGKQLGYSIAIHDSLLADLASSFPVLSARMMESPEFRRLQAFSCHGFHNVVQHKLHMMQRGLRDIALPARYEEAFASSAQGLESSILSSLGYTLACDGGSSHARRNYERYCATIPGCDSVTIGLVP